jgi:hypothetical protein
MEQTTNDSPSALRPVKRYIVSHDPQSGKSIYIDSPKQHYSFQPGFGHVARSYATSSLPARLANDDDVEAYRSLEGVSSYSRQEIVVPPTQIESSPVGDRNISGVNLVVLDLIPGVTGHWHQTVSIDFSICVSGEVIHELDSGERVELLPGLVRYSRLYLIPYTFSDWSWSPLF